MRYFVHNVIAHPLLVLCPPLGEWLHERTLPPEPACRVCDCTEYEACFPGCWWVEPDLCSACAPFTTQTTTPGGTP